MQLVDRRNAATLLPIIQQHVYPGTVVHSDEWAVYSQISSAGYIATHHSTRAIIIVSYHIVVIPL